MEKPFFLFFFPDDGVARLCSHRITLPTLLFGLVIHQKGERGHTDTGDPEAGVDPDDGYDTERADHRTVETHGHESHGRGEHGGDDRWPVCRREDRVLMTPFRARQTAWN